MMRIKQIVSYIFMLQVIFRHLTGTLAAKVFINQNITGLLGNTDTHLTCSFFPEKGEQIITLQILAKNITEDFDEKENIIAVFKPKKSAKLNALGEYLVGRVTLTNITNTSNNATLKFHILKCEDNKDYICKLYYNDMEDAIQNVKSDATRILVKVPVRDVHINKQPDYKQYDDKTDNITLTCLASGEPEPKYTWFKEINNNNVISRTSHYVLDDVIRNNSGVYICESYNTINGVYYTLSSVVDINITDELVTKKEQKSLKIFTVHAAYAIPVICAVVIVFICLTARKRNCKREKRNVPAVTVIYSEVNELTKLKYRLTQNQATSLKNNNVQHNAVDGAQEISSDPTLKYNMITGKLEEYTNV